MGASSDLQSPAMSILSFADRVLIYKPSPLLHRRNDSGELDVFEATGYFSGYTDATDGGFNGGSFTQKIVKEDSKVWRGRGRISLDMTIANMVTEECFNGGEEKLKENKFEHSSSPGGKLVKFLNSLFNQTNSKKRKKKKKTTKSAVQSLKDEDFRFPLVFAQTPTKNFEDFKQKGTPLKLNAKPDLSEEKKKKYSAFVNEKSKFSNGVAERQKKIVGNGVLEKCQKMIWRGKHEAEEQKCFHGGSVDADGGASDSSSDLFELQISNLKNFTSNDLPVYETTKLEKIKRKPSL